MLAAILAFVSAVAAIQAGGQTQTATAQPLAKPGSDLQTVFSTPETFAETTRLEISPNVDGTIADEEWDPLMSTPTAQTYFQWSPRTAYIAAKLPADQDLVASLDFGGKGWLIGKNHVEVRATMTNGMPVLRARILDATNAVGPAWIDAPGFAAASAIAATSDANGWTVEIKLVDPGLGLIPSDPGMKIGLRVDAIAASTPDMTAFLPRALTTVSLETARGTGLPAGMKFHPEEGGRVVAPGDTTSIRLTFNGNESMGVKSIEMRSEGLAKDTTSSTTRSFPAFDNKSRAFVDYDLTTDKAAPIGYRVARGMLMLGDKGQAITQTSYEIAPLLSFDLPVEIVSSEAAPKNLRIGVYIKSNSSRRIDADFSVVAPPGWKLINGDNKRFILYSSFGRKRQVFAVEMPANAHGAFPFVVSANVGGIVCSQTVWKYVR